MPIPSSRYIIIYLPSERHFFASSLVIDGIGIDTDEQLCHNIANEVKIDLIKSGFVSNAERSLWQPVKRLVWLGTIIDTEYGSPKHKLFKARF
jgi:hypothetical protein